MEYYKEKEIKKYICDNLEHYEIDEDLHHNMFNTDYYIIGTHDAKIWLGDKVFDVINIIKDYEQDNFGEVSTDFSDPEKVVNMYVYIVGEMLLLNIAEIIQQLALKPSIPHNNQKKGE